MTYYRRTHYPVDGQADIPNRILEEFQRIRSAFMGVDHNNVLIDGVDRDTIMLPNDSTHEGCSDVVDSADAFGFIEDLTSESLTFTPHDGVWQADTDMEIDVIARSESLWLVGFSAEANWVAPTTGYAVLDLQLSSSTAGTAAGVSHGILAGTTTAAPSKSTAIGQVSMFRLPAGRCVFRPNYRVRWNASTTLVTYTDRVMFAVGFYQT